MKNKVFHAFRVTFLVVMLVSISAMMWAAKPIEYVPNNDGSDAFALVGADQKGPYQVTLDSMMSGSTLANGTTLLTTYRLVDLSDYTGTKIVLKSLDMIWLNDTAGAFIIRVGVVSGSTGNTNGKIVWFKNYLTANSGIDLNLAIRNELYSWPGGGLDLGILSGTSLSYIKTKAAQVRTDFAQNDTLITPTGTGTCRAGDIVMETRPLVISGSTAVGTIRFVATAVFNVE